MENDGFIAESLEEFKNIIQHELQERYELAHRINRLAQQLQYQLEIPTNNRTPDKLYSAILYTQTLSTYQGLLLLSYRGMSQQVKMLLRCMLESLFPLVAIQKNQGYSEKLIENDEYCKRNAYYRLLQYRIRKNPEGPRIETLQKLLDETEQNIKEKKILKLSVYENADKAGLLDYYETLYAYMSSTVHAHPRSLERYLILDFESNLKELKNEPETEGFDNIYATSIELILLAITAIGEIFKLDVKEIDDEIRPILVRFCEEDSNG